ncbi:tetratricopeptide repeat protein [Aestuariibacter halophilus]|uniref:Tetratricopeptide repeat protein n=1 Tax=Fluctibacter halophilus TaxID=226011 RepID=A0ABS8G2Q4_9ALTE|nr:tetratricopeptide repeat protein [Aestuariibacter halophilus]MCC2614867.1 tetratricopeptide repeat protein [Aestuariibacter halophilus]
MVFKSFFAVVCLLSVAFGAVARNNVTCDIVPGNPLTNQYGPWDFTNPAHQEQLPIVINNHFSSNVERLIKGQTGKLEHDLDYTLRAIPNFHRALFAVSRYQRQQNIEYATIDDYYTAECYFKRAIYFQPADATTRALFGLHLHSTGNYEGAEENYLSALTIQPENPEIHYNLGLLYVDMGKLEAAQKHAKVAYDAGFPLDGLKNKIERARSNTADNG